MMGSSDHWRRVLTSFLKIANVSTIIHRRVSHAATLYIAGVGVQLTLITTCHHSFFLRKLYDNTANAGLRPPNYEKVDPRSAQASHAFRKMAPLHFKSARIVSLHRLREPYHADVGPFGSAGARLHAVKERPSRSVIKLRVRKL